MDHPSVTGVDAPLGTSVRHLIADLMAALGQRIELGTIETRIAFKRAVWGLLLSFASAFVAVAALIFLTLGIILAFWSESLVTAFLITGLLYVVLAMLALWVAFIIASRKPIPLTSLINVLKEDREWILGRKPD